MKNTVLRAVFSAGAIIGYLLLINGPHSKADPMRDSKVLTANEPVQVTLHVNSNVLQFTEIIPVMDENQNMFVPIRSFAEQMGYSLSCSGIDPHVNHIEFSDGSTTVHFQTDSAIAIVDDNTVDMGSKPWNYKDNVYIPFRFLMESFGLELDWNLNDLKTVPCIKQSSQTKAKATAEPVTQNVASHVIRVGKSYLGTPYVWGGTTPSGFDCAGYVRFIFGRNGISLSGTSREMYRRIGSKVRSLRLGDLVFFGKDKSITHVGVYIGNNQYLNASSGKAYRVVISNLSSAWSKRTYVGAKRVLQQPPSY